MARATLLFTLLLGVLFSLVFLFNSINSSNCLLKPTCPSEIYCHGKLLHTIQMAKIFPDSKTFVDMKMKQNSTQILKLFYELLQKTCNHPTVDDLKKFVEANFEPAGSEFEEWEPSDWHASPRFLEKIDDRGLKKWAEELHDLWKHLGRKMKEDVYKNSHLYSIIPVPHPVVVPGGRFREFYYWDSYWIVRGLLLSEMYDTVKGMLNNFVSIVDRYGLIPNGGRNYYTMRSQPPLFIAMVDSYLEFTNDTEFLGKNIKYLEKEFLFWIKNRKIEVSKNGRNYTLCQYRDNSSGPRPESYREDVETAQFFETEDRNRFYSELKSAAESGWDFSSRWFINDKGKNQGNLTDIKIKSIVPVDLNAIIYWNAKLLSKFFKILNRPKEAEVYEKISDKWLEAVDAILWDPELGAWLDYDLLNNKKRDYVYPSNLSPLWTNCYPADKKSDYTEKVVNYMIKRKVLDNLGGVPASLEHTGEQWDYPNAWPPHQYIIIMGLENANTTVTKRFAFELAEKWVQNNYKAYTQTKAMYEKYDATVVGGHGGGGEYEVQLGFGWTNGVIMELLDRYGGQLVVVRKDETSSPQQTLAKNAGVTYSSNHFGPIFTLLLAFGATLTAGCIGAVVYAKRHSPWPDKSKYMKIPGASNL